MLARSRSLVVLGSVILALFIESVEAETISNTIKQMDRITQSSPIKVTGVKLNPTPTGIEVILESDRQINLQPSTSTDKNTLITEIPNTILALPEGKEFRALKPSQGIAEVRVTQINPNTIRIAIAGETGAPTAEIVPSEGNYVLSVTSPQEEIEIVVTQESGIEDSYRVPNASTATRTDTPIRDIPQSIQVIPRQVLEDRQVIRLGDAIENISGVTNKGSYSGYEEYINIRGFNVDTFQGNYFRDGIRLFTFGFPETANLERIEVLKGPASVLFGQAQPGGIINLVTKKPLQEFYFSPRIAIGNYDTYQGWLDVSGPLDADKTLLYRLNMYYENSGSFRDFVEKERLFIAPAFQWQIGANTSLTIDAEFTDDSRTMDDGIPAIGDRPADIPINRFLHEPFSEFSKQEYSIGYVFKHQFSDRWSIQNAFRVQWLYPERYYPLFDTLDEETGELTRSRYYAAGSYENYATQTDIIGKFATGSIQHQLLLGFEYAKTVERPDFGGFDPYPSINIFDPVYTREGYPKEESLNFFRDDITSTWGFYLQDQINLLPNLILLVGGRFDSFDQDRSTQDLGEPKQEFEQSDSKFSPRVGLVYQPSDAISLYASYTESFQPSIGANRNFDDSAFEPETGTQYEIGIKTDWLDGRLSATLAAFHLSKQNVTTEDPNDPRFSIQTGEQTSKGIELDVAGEILPGWNIIAAAAYIDARITKDNTLEEGNWLDNVPEFSTSLWTTYEIQAGDLRGLGFGLGLYYVGDRYGDLDNSYTLPSYFRTDAAIFYRRDDWRVALNIRNLFDVEYFTGSDGGRNQIQPGSPFVVTGSFAIEF
jgi:iron complex outermembrane recepter protein